MIHEHAIEGEPGHEGSEEKHQHRAHYSMPLNTLLAALGLPGDGRKIWLEDACDVVHIIADDEEAPAQPCGAYPEERWVSHRVMMTNDSLVETVLVGGKVTRTLVETRECAQDVGR